MLFNLTTSSVFVPLALSHGTYSIHHFWMMLDQHKLTLVASQHQLEELAVRLLHSNMPVSFYFILAFLMFTVMISATPCVMPQWVYVTIVLLVISAVVC